MPPVGLSLAPFRGLRPSVDGAALARRLCPPYDVIGTELRAQLLALDPDNAVNVVLPEPAPAGYARAARWLAEHVADGRLAVDGPPALYVYEMTTTQGDTTRGLLGAVELRAPQDGVILPHEDTMAGPVADRLAVMNATDTDLEPIYLVYDGGGPASQLLHRVDDRQPVAHARTADGTTHRLWTVTDASELDAVAADLDTRRALIADGHHRYATYLERQRLRRQEAGAGPWDRGLALLVDTLDYGPRVEAIHRVLPELTLSEATRPLDGLSTVTEVADPRAALESCAGRPGFHAVLTDGRRSVLVRDDAGTLAEQALRPGEAQRLGRLTVSVLHRVLVGRLWNRPDDVEHVGYAHSVTEAVERAVAQHGIAVLIDATAAEDVAAVAAAGARMPRKSTLFTPKPVSGLVMRRLGDQRQG